MSTDPSAEAARSSWRLFLATYEPLRPDLYRYCRHLTGSPWDAEDTVQDALARAFVALATMAEPPKSPRAWLFRIASNLWLNRVRRREPVPSDLAAHAEAPALDDPRRVREAAGTLLSQLAPQERAAVVLKDAFGFSLDEIADVLSTTPGAVKSALHRGRTHLLDPDPERRPARAVPPPALDAFCAAFNARDVEALTALLLDGASLEYPGFRIEAGRAAIARGTLTGTLRGCPEGGFELTAPPRCEAREHRGEWLLLWWSGAEVHAVVRATLEDGAIAGLVSYYHAPEVMTEICGELAVPYRTHGYRPAAEEMS